MNAYEESFKDGELWIKQSSGVLYPASSALSSLYLKYLPINFEFYQELKNNKIIQFDTFYDVLFIETNKGHIFDKMTFENEVFVPFSQDNRFLERQNTSKYLDLWLDERNKKIYTSIIEFYHTTLSSVQIDVLLEQFDIIQNIFNPKLLYKIDINFGQNIYFNLPKIETPKLTYNNDTKTFNVSFILRGPNDEFGLISSNIVKSNILEVSETNCFIPYKTDSTVSTSLLLQNLLEMDIYN